MNGIFDDIKLQIELLESKKCQVFLSRNGTVIKEIITEDPRIKLNLVTKAKSI